MSKIIDKIMNKWEEKIEKNAFKSILTYKDRHGKEHSETVFFKRSQPPFIENFGDWGRIYPPIKENSEGKVWYKRIDWFNFWFGGWRNLIKLILILIIIGLVLFQFYQNFIYIEEVSKFCPIINETLG